MEMLNTDEQTPQILIKIDGMDALCLDMNCDFTYTDSTATIVTQELSDLSLLTLTGTLLPNATTDNIWFGPIRCSEVSEEYATIPCELNTTCTDISNDDETFNCTFLQLDDTCIEVSTDDTTVTCELDVTCTEVSNNDETFNCTFLQLDELCTEYNDIAAITCQLDDTRVAGQWISQIMTVYGLTPNTISTTIDIPVITSAITPSTDVNYLGATYM